MVKLNRGLTEHLVWLTCTIKLNRGVTEHLVWSDCTACTVTVLSSEVRLAEQDDHISFCSSTGNLHPANSWESSDSSASSSHPQVWKVSRVAKAVEIECSDLINGQVPFF